MSVSKRLRYEVFRRDDHSCRYCGASAPDVKITIDHVLPVALGGADVAENLVTACVDCNSGKSSSSPDQSVVAQVSEDARRWAIAVQASAMVFQKEYEQIREYVDEVDAIWSSWSYGSQGLPIPRPANWRESIEVFHRRGLPIEVLLDAAGRSLANSRVDPSSTWRYFMGIAWKRLTEIEEVAKAVFDMESAEMGKDGRGNV